MFLYLGQIELILRLQSSTKKSIVSIKVLQLNILLDLIICWKFEIALFIVILFVIQIFKANIMKFRIISNSKTFKYGEFDFYDDAITNRF